jgi:2-C-methyl-D-erythritol 4-phosphate cytidylyltransferase
MSLPIEFIAIHDGARAFITLSLIIRTLATATVFGASVPAVPPIDALKIIDENGIITHHIDRSQAVGMQTPQIFRYPEIWEAHRAAHSSSKRYIDDTEIYSDFGGTVGISQGDRSNRKITWLEDIPDAHTQIEQYLELLEEAKKMQKASSLLQQSVQEYQREHGT